jgi:hypothetical protein
MPDPHQEIINTLDGEPLTPRFQPSESLSQKKIRGCETLIQASSDNSLHGSFNLFNIADQFNLNTRLEFISGKYHGLNFRWLRLF